MSASFLTKTGYILGLSLWVVFVFLVSQIIVGLLAGVAEAVIPALGVINDAVISSTNAAIVYGLSIGVVVMTPRLLKRNKVTLEMLGLGRLLSWSDMGVGLLALLPYFLLSALLIYVLGLVWSGFNPNQQQAIPFHDLTLQYELIIAFVTLVIVAPFAEETLFRGYLLGKMKEKIKPWVAVIVTALVFGALHLPGEITKTGITWQWGVALDTLSLGLILGSLRLFTGSIWAGILLHMFKNAIAFYFLFIYPTMPGTL